MTSTLILFISGLALLILGAELLVRGASRLAAAFGVSPLVIGLQVSAEDAGVLLGVSQVGIGGALALASIVVFAVLGLQTGEKPGGIVLLCAIYALPAFLFLFSWWRTRRHATSKTTPIA